MKKVILKIEGMSCSGCQKTLEKYLNKQEGIKSATVNLVMAEALIYYEDNLTIDDLNRFVKEAGYTSLGEYNAKKENKKDHHKLYLIILFFVGLFLMYVSMGKMIGLKSIPILDMMKHPINYGITLLILTIPFLIYGFDIIKSGIRKLIALGPNMDSLVTMGIFASFLYSFVNLILIIKGHSELVHHLYFESVAMIIYFVKIGRFIDHKSKEKTKEAITELVQITPSMALLKTKDGEKEVTIDEVKIGDILICKPGMKVAVDGTITKGESHLDEAFITGESIPPKKGIKDKVVAGSLNLDGYIEYEAEKIGINSTISEIVRLVKESVNTKAPIGALADKVSGYFVPSIMGIAVLTFLGYLLLGFSFNEAILSFVSVLVIACPCALGLATPMATIISEGAAAQKGILIKSSEILENAHKVDTIVFDKTGTLTYGNLKIAKIYNYSKLTDEEIIKYVASLEEKSTHPIATSFINYRKEKNIPLLAVEKSENLAGLGIKGRINKQEVYVGNAKILNKLKIKNEYAKEEKILSEEGNSIVYLVLNKKIMALIGVKDIIRDNAKEVIAKLTKMSKDIIMLSGDNLQTAQKVGDYLKINKVEAGLMPKDKKDYLKKLKDEKKLVMMVGDGINDAPSLANAFVGVSIGSGTDIAGSSSDVIIMDDNLTKIVDLLNISKKTIRIIKQNLFWAFIYNILMIPIAMGLFKFVGLSISPMVASISMVISSLTVVLNSLRLKSQI